MSECLELEQWLDEGRPEPAAAARTAHAAGCVRCGQALAAALALEAALAAPPSGRAPPGFTEAVLARVESRPRSRDRVAWLRRVGPPGLALALCLGGAAWAAVLSWRALTTLPPADLVALASRHAAALDGLVAGWARAGVALSPDVQALGALAVAAAAAAGSWWLFRRAEALGPTRVRA